MQNKRVYSVQLGKNSHTPKAFKALLNDRTYIVPRPSHPEAHPFVENCQPIYFLCKLVSGCP